MHFAGARPRIPNNSPHYPTFTDTSNEPMMGTLYYGEAGALGVDVPPDSVLVDCTQPRGEPLDDPVAAVAAALIDPLDFPPLCDATVPGDQIVVALDRQVPKSASVVAAIVHTLLEGHARPAEIAIVAAAGHAPGEDPTCLLPASVRNDIQLLEHDPRNSSALSYLASSREGHRISINRTLFDADIVLPVGTLRLPESLGYFGVHGGLFPAFSDEATIQRFRSAGLVQSEVHRRRRREEVEEAAWLLGVQFTVQVAPGRGDSILHVLAGESNAVARRGRELCASAWLHHASSRAGLVLAAIEGGREHQSWDNFARALFAAVNAVRSGGSIVLCTELSLPPGPALQRLMAGDDEDAVLRELRRERSPDAIAASLLIESRRHANVYLISGLDRDTVEDLGMGFVGDPDDVTRLCQRYDSCVLLGTAQHAVLSTAEN